MNLKDAKSKFDRAMLNWKHLGAMAEGCEEPDVAVAAPTRRSGIVRVRLKKKPKDSVTVGAVLNQRQYDGLRKRAKDLDLTISQVIRAAINEFIRGGPWPPLPREKK